MVQETYCDDVKDRVDFCAEVAAKQRDNFINIFSSIIGVYSNKFA